MPGGDPSAISVEVSPDRATAELILPSNLSREMISAAVCEALLRQADVEITPEVRAAVAGLLQQPVGPGQAARAVVARATPARDGGNGRVEWLVQPPAAASPPPADAAEPATKSYYDRSAFVMVTPGQKLAKIHRPTAGEDGRDVTGKTLVARAGKEEPLKLDESILCDAGGNLIAQAEGVLIRNGATACIRKVLEVAEYVDFSTGNIEFHGDVVVHKGVRDLFTVRATGTIEVHGLIEAATICADGDIVARGGFAGRERGRAECGRDFHGKYLDNVEGEIRGDLAIEREAVNCALVIHGGVEMPHGTIVGGRVVATGRVHIGTLGSGGAVPTELVVGSVPRLEPLHIRLQAFVEKLRADREGLVAQQKQLDMLVGKKRATSIDKERQTELFFEISNLDAMMAKAEPTLHALTERINGIRTVDVVVERRVFPGVAIVVGHQRYQLSSELRGPVRIVRDGSGALAYFRNEERLGLLVQVADLHAAA